MGSSSRGAAAPAPLAGHIGVKPWVMLALGVLSQAAGTVLVSTPAFLIPYFTDVRGLSLASAAVFASAPTVGMVLTLVAWGALADRVGERWVIAGGTALAAGAAAGAAASTSNHVMLGAFFLLGGMASASANAASGRLVVGWFPRHRRGLAMGIRQMSQPLGVAAAALIVPSVASAGGISAVMLVSVVVCGVLAVACGIILRDPARPPKVVGTPVAAGPYRRGTVLWRIHGVSMLLVVPQFTLSTFGLVWLFTDQSLSAAAAGLVIGASQFIGAVGRIAVGILSDRVGSRMRPLRWVSLAAAGSMLLLAVLDIVQWPLAVAVLVIATTVSVADNGLAFTAVAEIAGPRWSGRALGIQNTGQFIAASAVAPAAGALIGAFGFPVAFLAAAACALVAVPLVPHYRDDRHRPPEAPDPRQPQHDHGTPPARAAAAG